MSKKLIVGLVVFSMLMSVMGTVIFAEETLRLSGWVSSPEETKLLKNLLKSFEDEYPDIKVKYEPISGNYMQKIQTMLAAGNAPDVFYLDSSEAPTLMNSGALQPLDKYIEETNFDLEDFSDSLLNGFNWEGSVYGLPKDVSTLALFYNKELFDKAGLEYPDKSWTWQDYITAGKKITKDTDDDGEIDQWGMVLNANLSRFLPFVYQNKGKFINVKKGEMVAGQKALKALEFYSDLKNKHEIATTPSGVGAQWLGDALAKGNVGMVLTGNWTIPYMENNAPKVEYGTAVLPKKKQRATLAFTVGYVIPKQSDKKEAAWKLLSYLTGKEGMRKWTNLGLALPSRHSVMESFKYQDDPLRQALIAGIDHAHPWQFVPGFGPVLDTINSELQAVMLNGKDPKKAIKAIREKGNKEL